MAMRPGKQIEATHDDARGNGYPVRDLNPQLISATSCTLLGRDTRKHPLDQLRKLAASIERFGFVLPILIDAERRVVAGWGLVLAARRLGLSEVPAVCLTDLSDADLRALRLALNRLTEDSAWDDGILSIEFAEILELDSHIDLTVSAFEPAEIDLLLDGNGIGEEDELPEVGSNARPVTRDGDLWALGAHRLLCGNALDGESYARLLGNEKVQSVFADPPYNVRIPGHASGLGRIKHGDFAMASGELSPTEFQSFLTTSLGHAASHSINGAIAFVCMDWRHMGEMLAAGKEVYSGGLVNLCVWRKDNAGMGSFYRSQHELVFIFKVGTAAHVNNIMLGKHGRHRSNVWDYVSQNSLSGSRKGKLALHPTPKPVALIADAMRDCSNRNDLILDPFGGIGPTLIAAERTGRRARVIEINPTFVDASIERWQRLTGGTALHVETGQPFPSDGGTCAAEPTG